MILLCMVTMKSLCMVMYGKMIVIQNEVDNDDMTLWQLNIDYIFTNSMKAFAHT
jgi:hypothetical protein